MATREFYKMSGSGNDFVVFDARREPAGAFDDQVVIEALCARGTGVGADGLVFLEPPQRDSADFRMRYFNSDGLPASLCGNAALCITSLASEIGAGHRDGMRFETDSGFVDARMVGAQPEIDLPPVQLVRPDAAVELEPGESRIGFALVGVPHLVALCDPTTEPNVSERGRALRMHPAVHPEGANANFVTRHADGTWSIRTYERGVEQETLACGTGAVASAILLNAWGLSGLQTTLMTRSGRPVTVCLRRDGELWWPTLRGEGRLVYTGKLADR